MTTDLQLGTARLSALDGSDFIGVQIDGLGDEPGLPPFELLHPAGFASRPAEPDSNGRGALALYWTEGRDKYAILLGDPRESALVPNLKPGERCFYGPKGQFVRMHDDGAVSMHATHDGTLSGFSIFAKVSPGTGWRVETPWGHETLGPDGYHVRHSSSARIDMGSIAGFAAPLDALGSYATISADIVSIEGSAVSIGTDGGATNAAAVTALLGLLTAMAAAIDGKNGAPSTIVTALAAVQAVIAQLGKVV